MPQSDNAFISKISVKEVPELNNLLVGDVSGYQVLVGKNIKEGELVVFFDANLQLSEEFCEKNDLIKKTLPDGTKKGYIEENRRIKALKFKGIKSEGLALPLDCLKYTGYDLSTLTPGMQFNNLNNHSICKKYVTQASVKASNALNKEGKAHKALITFPKSVDVGQFRKGLSLIPKGSLIIISAKLHGSSSRYINTLDTLPPKLFSILENKFFSKLKKYPKLNRFREIFKNLKYYAIKYFPRKEWVHLIGTRNVVLNSVPENNIGSFYGSEKFRYDIHSNIKLHKNEILFGEIVGYLHNGKPIMASQDIINFKNKSIIEKFGKKIIYKYGNIEGHCKLYVYRMALTNDDGYLITYSWEQMEQRCKELGLDVVPVIDRFFYDGCAERLFKYVDKLVNGVDGMTAVPDIIDPSHFLEGCVIRYESPYGIGWLKHKNFWFGVAEGFLREDPNFLDLEDVN